MSLHNILRYAVALQLRSGCQDIRLASSLSFLLHRLFFSLLPFSMFCKYILCPFLFSPSSLSSVLVSPLFLLFSFSAHSLCSPLLSLFFSVLFYSVSIFSLLQLALYPESERVFMIVGLFDVK